MLAIECSQLRFGHFLAERQAQVLLGQVPAVARQLVDADASGLPHREGDIKR